MFATNFGVDFWPGTIQVISFFICNYVQKTNLLSVFPIFFFHQWSHFGQNRCVQSTWLRYAAPFRPGLLILNCVSELRQVQNRSPRLMSPRPDHDSVTNVHCNCMTMTWHQREAQRKLMSCLVPSFHPQGDTVIDCNWLTCILLSKYCIWLAHKFIIFITTFLIMKQSTHLLLLANQRY